MIYRNVDKSIISSSTPFHIFHTKSSAFSYVLPLMRVDVAKSTIDNFNIMPIIKYERQNVI